MNNRRVSVRNLLSGPGFFALFFTLSAPLLLAQPSPSALADQLDGAYTDRIQNIDRLRISTVAVGGMLEGMENTALYEKVNREGRDVLVEVDEEGRNEGVYQGMMDDVMSGMVRNARSISEEQMGGYAVYRVEVDDPEFLSDLQTGEAFANEDLDNEDFTIESATIYIDREELLLRYISFSQQETDGRRLTMNFEMTDYQTHTGFPVPHLMRIEVEGLDQMISDDELAEARQAMSELETQLESMPEAQRNMVENQLRPQMERFETMLEQGDLGNVEVRVVDVFVNKDADNGDAEAN